MNVASGEKLKSTMFGASSSWTSSSVSVLRMRMLQTPGVSKRAVSRAGERCTQIMTGGTNSASPGGQHVSE